MSIICVLCLIVVPLPSRKNPFAVKINKKKYYLMIQEASMKQAASRANY
jgi:hypothetical protein